LRAGGLGGGDVTPLGRALTSGPNLITLSRLGMVGVAVVVFFAGETGPAIVLGALAGVTDIVDGWWARRTGQTSRLGEILDQFCDVALELALLVMAVGVGKLPLAILVPYVLREVWVGGLRRFAIELGQNIPSRLSGKVKSAFLGWSFVPLFLPPFPAIDGWLGRANAGWISAAPLRLGQAGMWTGIALSLFSGLGYTRDFVRVYGRAAGLPAASGRDRPPV
jgi:CDP-diacylglycerol--glycerol-3-phosphate 3-phosphatidyltransferase